MRVETPEAHVAQDLLAPHVQLDRERPRLLPTVHRRQTEMRSRPERIDAKASRDYDPPLLKAATPVLWNVLECSGMSSSRSQIWHKSRVPPVIEVGRRR